MSGPAWGQDVRMDSLSSVTYTQGSPYPQVNENLLNLYGSQVLIPTQVSSSENYGPGSASGFVIGSMGVLHAFATAAYPLDSNYADGNEAYDQSTVRDDDSLVVTSNTLAAGTAVTLDFEMVMDGTIDVPIATQFGAVNGWGYGTLNIIPTVGNVTNLSYTLTTSGSYLFSAQIATTVGASIGFNYSLQAYAQLYAYSPDYHSITSDFSNTAVLTIASENPNASFSTSSGYNYAPAPEPASVCVLSVGLAAILRKRLAKRR
ncbi:MAG TPA: hypothetical protein VKT78_19900 [Fimbriimonadaceae bacterium]|nr:hypothetical protein [Fimbriimonadaceae bacterium]